MILTKDRKSVIAIFFGSIILSVAIYFSLDSSVEQAKQYEITNLDFTQQEREFYLALGKRRGAMNSAIKARSVSIGEFALNKQDLKLTGYYDSERELLSWPANHWSNKYEISSLVSLLKAPLVQAKIMQELMAIYLRLWSFYKIPATQISDASLCAIFYLHGIKNSLLHLYGYRTTSTVNEDIKRFAHYHIDFILRKDLGMIDALRIAIKY